MRGNKRSSDNRKLQKMQYVQKRKEKRKNADRKRSGRKRRSVEKLRRKGEPGRRRCLNGANHKPGPLQLRHLNHLRRTKRLAEMDPIAWRPK
jgi:hypothetical protein